MSTRTDKSNRFWNRMAEIYAKSPVSDPDAYEIKLRQTQQHFTSASQVLQIQTTEHPW